MAVKSKGKKTSGAMEVLVRQALLQTVRYLTELKPAQNEDRDDSPQSSVNAAIATLKAVREIVDKLTVSGECRVTKPFAELRPVVDANGDFMWCCTHATEHCTKPR